VTAGLAKPPTLVGSTVIVLSSGLPAAAQGAERVEFTRELLHDFSEPGITVDEALARTRDALVNGSQVEAPFIVGSLGRRLCLAGCERADSSAVAKELNRQLDDAMSRIRELESERVTNADEQRRSAERIAALEREVRLREAAASATTERDRRKDAELADLRQKLEHERSNQRRLDEMGVVVQKAKALEDANFALSKEKQDAASRIAALQADIDARSRAAGQAGEANLRSQDEIARLRRELDDARLKQRDLQGAEARAKANQDEISTLRATIAELRTEQAKREREFVEQQRARDDELRRLQQAVRDRGNSQPRPGADRSNPPPIPAGF
jgi:chromosome segregation ATPase